MHQFRNILVYAEDGDAGSLADVVELAREQNAQLSVCDVIPPPPALPDPDGVIDRLKTVSVQLAYERLSALCAPYARDIEIDYTVLIGIPFLAVTEQVMLQGFDLVVHVSDPGDEGGLNPTGMHLMRKCPATVWSQPTVARSRPRTIVLAVDRNLGNSTARTTAMALAQAATAGTVAANDAPTLHIVHAWRPFAEELLTHTRTALSQSDIDAYAASQKRDHERWLDELAQKLGQEAPGCTIKTHLRRGGVTEVVQSLADETEAELIVMGTIGTSDVPGVLIGTSAEGILLSTRIPVLALKPLGFTSPLRFGVARPLPANVDPESTPQGATAS
jgi:universal stress protein E